MSEVPRSKERGSESDVAYALEIAERWLSEDPSFDLEPIHVTALSNAVRELDGWKKYAEEGWAWLDDALNALGAKTVFDIPKAVRPE